MSHPYTLNRIPYDWETREPWLELPFPVEEFEGRVARLQAKMLEGALDALVIYGSIEDSANVRYLSNFDGWFGRTFLIVPKKGEMTLVTNALFHGEPMHSGFHTTWVRDIRPVLHPHATPTPVSVGAVSGQVLRESGFATGIIGLAGGGTLPKGIESTLTGSIPAATWRSADHLLTQMRRIKSQREIEVMRLAGKATDAGFLAAMNSVRPGVTEFEIAGSMVGATIAAGARPRAGGTVQTGARTCLKNIGPTHRVVQDGDLIFLDNPASVGGYWTDAARNFVAGVPSPEIRDMLEVVLDQSEQARAAIRPGVRICDVQRTMRDIALKVGLGDWDYTELVSGAHGGGLSLVEEPHWWWGNPELLEVGMIFYLEPVIVKHGIGTASIEDVIVVTQDGCESLTNAPRKTW